MSGERTRIVHDPFWGPFHGHRIAASPKKTISAVIQDEGQLESDLAAPSSDIAGRPKAR